MADVKTIITLDNLARFKEDFQQQLNKNVYEMYLSSEEPSQEDLSYIYRKKPDIIKIHYDDMIQIYRHLVNRDYFCVFESTFTTFTVDKDKDKDQGIYVINIDEYHLLGEDEAEELGRTLQMLMNLSGMVLTNDQEDLAQIYQNQPRFLVVSDNNDSKILSLNNVGSNSLVYKGIYEVSGTNCIISVTLTDGEQGIEVVTSTDPLVGGSTFQSITIGNTTLSENDLTKLLRLLDAAEAVYEEEE